VTRKVAACNACILLTATKTAMAQRADEEREQRTNREREQMESQREAQRLRALELYDRDQCRKQGLVIGVLR